MIATQALIVAVFVSVHLFAGKLRFLHGIPRSRWLSLAGGISVAYVFIHIFPELREAQQNLGDKAGLIPFLEHHAYVVSLMGLAVFYGLERAVKATQKQNKETSGDNEAETTTGAGVFWIHVGTFAFYNLLIGYLLVHREAQNLSGLAFYGTAMAVHFLVNDFGLRQDHKNNYRHTARWILAAAIVAGWLLGLASTINEAATGALFAFLAGGVILNVLKEELPEERRSRFLPFAAGLICYTALLLLA